MFTLSFCSYTHFWGSDYKILPDWLTFWHNYTPGLKSSHTDLGRGGGFGDLCSESLPCGEISMFGTYRDGDYLLFLVRLSRSIPTESMAWVPRFVASTFDAMLAISVTVGRELVNQIIWSTIISAINQLIKPESQTRYWSVGIIIKTVNSAIDRNDRAKSHNHIRYAYEFAVSDNVWGWW